MALQLPSAPLQQLPHQAAAAELRLQLVPDPCMPERLYVVHAHGESYILSCVTNCGRLIFLLE